ncbi:uncharacterized protein [Bemisia tabaci]|uniref:uncharacterized protein n=1 Tax=Bemisia tabaci TaxID=7038 RepID=UPI003B281FF0
MVAFQAVSAVMLALLHFNSLKPSTAMVQLQPNQVQIPPVFGVRNSDLLQKAQGVNLCGHLTKRSPNHVVTNANKECSDAVVAFRNLAPVNQRQCPGARDGKCKKSIGKWYWYCSVQVNAASAMAQCLLPPRTVNFSTCVRELDLNRLLGILTIE